MLSKLKFGITISLISVTFLIYVEKLILEQKNHNQVKSNNLL